MQTFDFDEFLQQGQTFFMSLAAELKALGLPVDTFKSDHLCFRVGNWGEYEFFKRGLARNGRLLTEAQVNGRPICTFALNEPFRAGAHVIELVELPAPKPGVGYVTGFEHAEFVISEPFERFRSRFPQLGFAESGDQALNPELCLKLEGKQAKFHHLPLERVIEIEMAEISDLIFDLDGTLVNSREKIWEINRVVFSEATGREVSLQEAIGKFHPEFSKLFEAFGVTCPSKQSHAIASWGAVAEQFSFELFDGAAELLGRLAELGFRLHLWTARDESSARKILRDNAIEEIFATCSFASDRDSKPQASSLNFNWKAARKNQVLVIGDSPSDMKGARNIRAVSAGALWDPHADQGSLLSAGAELLFHRTGDLADWLSSLADAGLRK